MQRKCWRESPDKTHQCGIRSDCAFQAKKELWDMGKTTLPVFFLVMMRREKSECDWHPTSSWHGFAWPLFCQRINRSKSPSSTHICARPSLSIRASATREKVKVFIRPDASVIIYSAFQEKPRSYNSDSFQIKSKWSSVCWSPASSGWLSTSL